MAGSDIDQYNNNEDSGMQELSLEQYEQLNPALQVKIQDKTLVYNTPNRATVWRVQTLLQKEPETIEWMNGFPEDSLLLDIGANVGMYTIYAAVVRGARVLAFEPESQNYALLNRNVYSNRLDSRVQAFPVALADGSSFDKLYLSQFSTGSSCHNFGETVDYEGRSFSPGYAQGCVSVALDELVARYGFPVPNYIKIDVDGIEHKVIAGGRETLRNPAVRSVLVEINSNRADHMATVAIMESLGFRWSPAQVEKYMRREGDFKGCGNYIFSRAG